MAGPQGGDVSGTTRIDVTQGEAIPVANASFDPGYSLDKAGGTGTSVTKADLVQGYYSYGHEVGDR